MRLPFLAVILFLALAPAPAAPRGADAAPATTATLRIVTLAPNLTDMVNALGFGENIVGVSDFCRPAPRADGSQPVRLGALHNPNYEALLALRPSLVILYPSYGRLVSRLESDRVETLVLPVESLDDIYSALRATGARLGAERRAEALERELRDRLGRLAAAREGKPRPRALLLISHAPGALREIYAAGRGTYLDELLRLAGAENALEDSPARYPLLSREFLLTARPDVIIDASFAEGAAGGGKQREAVLREYGNLAGAAGTRARYVFSDDPDLLTPGPAAAAAAERLAALLHGEPPAPQEARP